MQICEYPVLSITISCHSSAKKAFSPSTPHPFFKKYGLMDFFSYHTKPKSLLGYVRGDHSESVLPDIHTVVSFNIIFKSFISRKCSYIEF